MKKNIIPNGIDNSENMYTEETNNRQSRNESPFMTKSEMDKSKDNGKEKKEK